jgi:hypothetical protein
MRARIYADFMKIDDQRLILTCWGTYRDLCRAGVCLEEGQEVTFYCDSDVHEDLEVEGVVSFWPEGRDGQGCWVAQIDTAAIRSVVRPEASWASGLPCWKCGVDVSFDDVSCPSCGSRLSAPIAHPQERA